MVMDEVDNSFFYGLLNQSTDSPNSLNGSKWSTDASESLRSSDLNIQLPGSDSMLDIYNTTSQFSSTHLANSVLGMEEEGGEDMIMFGSPKRDSTHQSSSTITSQYSSSSLTQMLTPNSLKSPIQPTVFGNQQEICNCVHFRGSSSSHDCTCMTRLLPLLTNLHSLDTEEDKTKFDVILGLNKEAMVLCFSALRCGCLQDELNVTIFVALMQKVVVMYESLYTRLSSSNTISGEDSGYTTGNADVKIGTYRLEKDDEERLRAQIVGLELAKIDRLVGEFRALGSSSLREGGSAIMFYNALSAHLSRSVRNATERLEETVWRMDKNHAALFRNNDA